MTVPARRTSLAIAAFLLLVGPSAAHAAVKRGTYIEVATQTYIATNAAATAIKSLNLPCIRDGQAAGANLISAPLRITRGRFAFEGTSTLRGGGDTPIRLKVTGRFSGAKLVGTITYLDSPAPCANRSYTAKYYGINPQG